MKITFSPYEPTWFDACQALFESNCPAFFASEERQDYEDFLLSQRRHYFVGLNHGRVVCAFGYGAGTDDAPSLHWIMVDPSHKGRGLGNAMMQQYIGFLVQNRRSRGAIATSQHAESFFLRYGANRLAFAENGWGAGMHRIDMTLPISGQPPELGNTMAEQLDG